ncbi:ComEC/Rec2-like protein [Campylobacter rectus RM3267]|uniref:Competence protein, ComEC family n=2 Tax=Campylobacter rectus TaxID=203 RepID=A0A6G5QLI6_CAMRE|nr:ComEC/Rec2 family competence protein [Campylobacter rectus]EEF13691.1 ComEC/Rec2-like protein [Campylobacter rectus RM3267]QCD46489.1 competence protein, ComEC family [Campylobacter rectus]UEB47188.1 ComEC/Rec2 family competence protein [Campylobacter rectus]
MQKPQQKSIFENAREVYVFCLACALVFGLNLGFSYYKFREFKAQNGVILQAKILQNYEKTNVKGKIYRVLKLKTQDFSFYTTTRADFDAGANEQILIGAENKNVKFKEYLSGSFFMPSYGTIELRYADSRESVRDKIYGFISEQHESEKMTELFTALFLAAPVGKELRQDVNFYGVAHLIAISGYHLGLIFGALYFILRPIYRYFQARYFPYRNAKFDLSATIFAVLFCYLALIGFVPSFLRAFLMSLLALFLLARNVRIVSFELLFVVICAAVSLMPSLLFSIGFYFSCMGVFYIYLYLRHFGGRFSNLSNAILLNFWVFSAMILPVLYFFPLVSAQQLAVLPITPLFSLFYPLSALLHAFGAGGALDEYLLEFLSWRAKGVNLSVPFWLFLLYNALSLASVKSKILAAVIVPLNLLCFTALV